MLYDWRLEVLYDHCWYYFCDLLLSVHCIWGKNYDESDYIAIIVSQHNILHVDSWIVMFGWGVSNFMYHIFQLYLPSLEHYGFGLLSQLNLYIIRARGLIELNIFHMGVDICEESQNVHKY